VNYFELPLTHWTEYTFYRRHIESQAEYVYIPGAETEQFD